MVPIVIALFLALILALVSAEYSRDLMKQMALLAARVYAVPGGLGLVLAGLLALDGGGGWITGQVLAKILLAFLCVVYLVLVGVTSIVGALIALIMPKDPQMAAFLAVVLVSLSTLFLFVSL